MSAFDNLDRVLERTIKALERVPEFLSDTGDYVLRVLTRVLESVLRFLKRATRLVYRFLRDLLINLLSIAWNLAGLLAIPLFFALLWGVGRELANANVRWLGWTAQIVGAAGALLFFVALLASLSRRSTSNDKEGGVARRPHGAFGILIVLGVISIVAFSYVKNYKYSNSLLNLAETSASRSIVWCSFLGLSPVNSPQRRLYEAAGASLDPPGVPDALEAQLKGRVHYDVPLIVEGTLYNPTDWTVLKVKNSFRSRGGSSPRWEEACELETRLRPGRTLEFSCVIVSPPPTEGWHWVIDTWGFPPA